MSLDRRGSRVSNRCVAMLVLVLLLISGCASLDAPGGSDSTDGSLYSDVQETDISDDGVDSNVNEIAGVIKGRTSINDSEAQLSLDGCYYDQGQLIATFTFVNGRETADNGTHDERPQDHFVFRAYQNEVRIPMNDGLGAAVGSHRGLYAMVRPGGSTTFDLSWPVDSFDEPFILVIETQAYSSDYDSSELSILPSRPVP